MKRREKKVFEKEEKRSKKSCNKGYKGTTMVYVEGCGRFNTMLNRASPYPLLTFPA